MINVSRGHLSEVIQSIFDSFSSWPRVCGQKFVYQVRTGSRYRAIPGPAFILRSFSHRTAQTTSSLADSPCESDGIGFCRHLVERNRRATSAHRQPQWWSPHRHSLLMKSTVPMSSRMHSCHEPSRRGPITFIMHHPEIPYV